MKQYLVLSYPDACGGGQTFVDIMRLYGAVSGHGSGGMSMWRLGHAAQAGYFDDLRLRLLMSYHYYGKTDITTLMKKFGEPRVDILVDSGAFSALTLGASIVLDEYVAWLVTNQQHFTAYACLDVIGNHAATMVNQREMEKAGLKPIPVFHVNSDFKQLDALADEYDYIALGGMVAHKNKTKALIRWLVQCFKVVGGRSRLHGFGVSNWEILRRFRWYSTDSSSWAKGFRYGRVPLFDYFAGKFLEFGLGNPQQVYKHAKLIRAYGFDPEDFADRARFTNAKAAAISALSYVAAEHWLRHYWQQEPVNGKVYLANSNAGWYVAAQNGLKVYLADTSGTIDLSDVREFINDE